MIPIRPVQQAQPYRQGAREPSMALVSMLLGKPWFLPNPQDIQRQTQMLAGRRLK